MKKKENVTLIEGKFSHEEAKDNLTNVISAKIQFTLLLEQLQFHNKFENCGRFQIH